MTSPRVDLGAQSGNETQYVFSEGDVHQSDADNVGLAAGGEFIIHSLDFLTRRYWECLFFLVPVTTSVVAASTVPPVKVSVASTEVPASPVVSVVVPEASAVVPVPPAPSAESSGAVVSSIVPLAGASPPVPQEDSDVPLSQFLAEPNISSLQFLLA